MIQFFALWSHVLDETVTGVVHFFKQTTAYLSVDYTDILPEVNPKRIERSGI
jgi:hypothetical protein